MVDRVLWHSYWKQPQQDPYASRIPVEKIIKVGHENILRGHNKKPRKLLDTKKYWITEEQADFAHTIEPKVIEFFGWKDCNDIITAYRAGDISTFSNALIAFFEKQKDEKQFLVQELLAIFRWITVLDLHNPQIISGTSEYVHHLISQNENQVAINDWLIPVKFAISDRKDPNWMVHPYQIGEAIREKTKMN